MIKRLNVTSICGCVTSRCVRRSVMSAKNFFRSVVSACGHFGTTGTFHFVHCSVLSAKNFYRSVVSACGHFGTTGTFHFVHCSVMSAKEIYRSVVSAYRNTGTTAVSCYYPVSVELFTSTIFYYICIYRNLFELTV